MGWEIVLSVCLVVLVVLICIVVVENALVWFGTVSTLAVSLDPYVVRGWCKLHQLMVRFDEKTKGVMVRVERKRYFRTLFSFGKWAPYDFFPEAHNLIGYFIFKMNCLVSFFCDKSGISVDRFLELRPEQLKEAGNMVGDAPSAEEEVRRGCVKDC